MNIFEVTRITLGKPKVDKTKEFIEDFFDNTQEHPFNRKARIYGDAVIEIYPVGNEIHLSDILSIQPKSGAGTKAVRFLTALADKHSVKLSLTAKAYSRDKNYVTDTEQLARWYKKLGFEITDDIVDDPDDLEGYEQIDMTYYPR